MAKSQTDIIQYFSTPPVQIVAIDKNSTSENTTSTVTAEHSIASRTSSDNASKGGGSAPPLTCKNYPPLLARCKL